MPLSWAIVAPTWAIDLLAWAIVLVADVVGLGVGVKDGVEEESSLLAARGYSWRKDEDVGVEEEEEEDGDAGDALGLLWARQEPPSSLKPSAWG